MSFSINNKSIFIDSFQFLSYSSDSLVKNSTKDDFKYLSQEFHNNELDLGKQKGFYPYEYMIQKSLENSYQGKKFYSLLTGKTNSDKGYEYVLKAWSKNEIKKMKDYHNLYSRRDVLLSADTFEKFRNNNLLNQRLCPGMQFLI